MKFYIIKRILWMIPIFIGISFFSFILINLSPSDPAEVAIRVSGTTPTEENVAEIRQELGLDKPFMTRYADWITKALHGDFGKSYITRQPVVNEFAEAIPATLYLAAAALVIILTVSIAAGVFCALQEGSALDILIRGLIFVGTAIPSFWVGILLMWLLAVKIPVFPTSGMNTPASVVLPAVTLALGYIATYVRLLRNTMIQNKQANFVLYAKVRGLKNSTITKHVLKNSLHSSLTAVGMSIPKLIAGTVVVENIFAWPGVGRLCVTAIFDRDFPIIQAYVLIMAILFVVCNLLVDIGVTVLDPRMRQEEGA
ncbi:nickel/cobalt ABC transporter permease [Sporomusa acidovorans]|uniref:Nickel transport system permease protein NikB n=1 Tax=Sporomusa acidovorans (strain ATCC 49682 / DSM 3132 / Mol) TaxID=1123286 RepID=A0ABZ3IZK1_SPOA4|nr:nickel/cobalt ABC transporter permease [Sporomusa acidovorans]OZC22275.1 nickel transport system permease protein NikB [Sporomusa acidovorans DSM 3132]SDF35034.1 nickel transport system permease protein [Sporomusa acidovorans]